ncbi:MAG TPA: hypothetical protein VF528_07440 [Pyrinomonadaceae bacterium]|jgi:hypothetical protein
MNPLSARLKLSVCFLTLLTSVLSDVQAVSQTRVATQQSARITAIKASTVDPSNGEISVSDNIFDRQQGNKPPFAGSGAANYPTRYLLVMVEVTNDDGRKVELTATEGRRIVWRKISPAYMQAADYDHTYAIFFIEGDRCELVRLRARLVGPGKPSMMTKAIEFGCGE